MCDGWQRFARDLSISIGLEIQCRNALSWSDRVYATRVAKGTLEVEEQEL
jgi:hypothetical protein